MKESEFLGALLPSHPDLSLIIESIREKYKLPEVSPEGEIIEEVYLEDRIIPLIEFHQDIKNHLYENLSFLPEKTVKQYKAAKLLSNYQPLNELDVLPDDYKQAMEAMFAFAKRMATPIFQNVENLISQVANMIYEYLLNGEMGEVPLEWSRIVMPISENDETMILIIATQLADPEEVVKEFRQEYRKAFGSNRPRITRVIASTGYYLQLQKRNISWKRIIEEYIRLENVYLPKNTSSKKYRDGVRLCEQQLRKRLQRSKKILEIILVDKK